MLGDPPPCPPPPPLPPLLLGSFLPNQLSFINTDKSNIFYSRGEMSSKFGDPPLSPLPPSLGRGGGGRQRVAGLDLICPINKALPSILKGSKPRNESLLWVWS